MLWPSLAWFPYFYSDCQWSYCGRAVNKRGPGQFGEKKIINECRVADSGLSLVDTLDFWSKLFLFGCLVAPSSPTLKAGKAKTHRILS